MRSRLHVRPAAAHAASHDAPLWPSSHEAGGGAGGGGGVGGVTGGEGGKSPSAWAAVEEWTVAAS